MTVEMNDLLDRDLPAVTDVICTASETVTFNTRKRLDPIMITVSDLFLLLSSLSSTAATWKTTMKAVLALDRTAIHKCFKICNFKL